MSKTLTSHCKRDVKCTSGDGAQKHEVTSMATFEFRQNRIRMGTFSKLP